MNKAYYIASVAFQVESQIDLEEYEAEEEFLNPSVPTERIIPVSVELAGQIPMPEGVSYNLGTCRCWNKQGKEFRSFSLDKIAENAIVSSYNGEKIRIFIDKNIWKLHMHTFRIWSYIFLEEILLENNLLILHSASIILNHKAILFTAPSETGKTTQTDIWHRMNLAVEDLNGDRAVLMRTDKGWLACGIPISGTSTRCVQAAVPIKSIVFVNRNQVDTITHPSVLDKIRFLYGQVTINSLNENNAEKAFCLLEHLINEVDIVQLNCTMKDSAYHVLFHELYEQV